MDLVNRSFAFSFERGLHFEISRVTVPERGDMNRPMEQAVAVVPTIEPISRRTWQRILDGVMASGLDKAQAWCARLAVGEKREGSQVSKVDQWAIGFLSRCLGRTNPVQAECGLAVDDEPPGLDCGTNGLASLRRCMPNRIREQMAAAVAVISATHEHLPPLVKDDHLLPAVLAAAPRLLRLHLTAAELNEAGQAVRVVGAGPCRFWAHGGGSGPSSSSLPSKGGMTSRRSCVTATRGALGGPSVYESSEE